MSVIGIVCEFNPFHNGHKYLIDTVKNNGDTVICVMSGNFVQRGEPAIFPKNIRVETALLNGADIVLELPFVYATASAEIFASNAVKILASFGCDKIAFGAENTSLIQLEKAVDIMNLADFDEKIKLNLQKGINYPTARQKAFNDYNCDCNISTSNNILAIEYLRAIRKNNYNIMPVVVNRLGADYNDDKAVDGFASATHIRNLMRDNLSFSEYVPDNANDIYKSALKDGVYLNFEKYNIASLSLLRNANLKPNSANMAEGLENRIASAVKTSCSLAEIYDNAKTKRFTHSRIRRAVLSTMFDITVDDLNTDVPYCRLLGFNKSVNDKLGMLAKQSKIPFAVNYSDIVNLNSDEALRIFEIENKTSDIYSLSMQKTSECSTEMKYTPVKI